MDANAMTKRAFSATLLGHFRRTGPNRWDDFEWIGDPPEPLEVAAGVAVQLEPSGTDVRLRRRGQVIRVRWVPEAAERAALDAATPEEHRAHFLERYLELVAAPAGIGGAAFVAAKLSR
jgi:hypothetical protein